MSWGYSRYGQEAGRKHKFMCLRPAFAILIDVNRSSASCRSFQAQPDKMLYFQRLYGFRRKHPISLNLPETIENTGQTGFLKIAEDSSQTVVTPMLLTALQFRAGAAGTRS